MFRDIFVDVNNNSKASKFLNTSLKIINWLNWFFIFREYFFKSTSIKKHAKKEIDFFFVIILTVVSLILMFIRCLIFRRVKAILSRSFFMNLTWMIGESINLYGFFFEQYLDLLFGLSIGLILIFAPLYLSDKTRKVKLQYTR